MKNSKVADLLRLIDREYPMKAKKNNIYDPPAVISSAIKTMYRSYKKSHEFEILQNKIYNLRLHNNMEDENIQITPLTAKGLCQEHKMKGEDIEHMITLKKYLKPQVQDDLLQGIIQQCNRLTSLEEVMKSYKQIIKDKEVIKQKAKYEIIERQMIQKILSFQGLSGEDFKRIKMFMFQLPHHNENVLKMIGFLYEKATQLDHFLELEPIYQRLSERFGKDNWEVCLKVSTQKNLQKISEYLAENNEKKEQFLFVACRQAKYKMQNIQFICLKEKTKYIIQFIFLILSYEPLLWSTVIMWTKSLNNQCKSQVENYVKAYMENLFEIYDKKTQFKRIFDLCEKLIESGEEYLISNILIYQLFMRKQENFIRFKQIRKFMAWKTMEASFLSTQIWKGIFDSSFYYIDVVGQMFNYPGSLGFFKMFLETPETKQFFLQYLKSLMKQKPTKFKEIFLKIDQSFQGEILEYNSYAVLNNVLVGMEDYNLGLSIIRQLTDYPPSKYCVSILGSIMQAFSSSVDQQKVILNQVIRTLNIILTIRDPSELSSEFISHLRDLSEKLHQRDPRLMVELFKNIPEKMIDQLKKHDRNPQA